MESKVAEPLHDVAHPPERRQTRVSWRPGARGGFPLALPASRSRGPAASKLRDSIFRRLLLGADVLAVCGAFFATTSLSNRPLLLAPGSVLGLALVLVCAKLFGLYDRDDTLLHKTTLDEAPRLLHLATLCALGTWLAGSSVLSGSFDRHQALFLWVALLVLLVLLRAAARSIALRIAPPERCLLIGDAAATRALRSRLGNQGGINAKLVAHLDLDKIAPWSVEVFSAAKLAEVRDLAQTLDVHRAIVAPSSADAGEVLNLVRTLKAVGVRVSVLPRMLEVVGSSVEFDDLQGVTVMGVRRFELTRSSAAVKRAFDLLCASFGLLAVSPFMLMAAIAIRIEDGGPVFFRQQRVGRYGDRFDIYKFRTMVPNAEALKDALRERNDTEPGLFKIADDPRVTRVGRLLRKTSIDELPQLLNILRGEMSMVGPRPLVVDEDLRVEGWHRRRLELTPGMTGPWQILGPARVPLAEMVVIDYLYAANWSLWTDMKILLRTVCYVTSARGL
jgi:exopolysaccharide biosynthesis polyprenyl glycosylphosphotransferase